MNQYSDEWSAYSSVQDDLPIFVRYRVSLKEAIGHPEYPFQIGINVLLLEPTANGLPTDSEAEVLFQIEDMLEDAFKDNAELVMTITAQGAREFILYANEWLPEQYEKNIQLIRKDFASYEIQFMMKKDAKWNTFKRFSGTK